jgi:hypothetical protein
MLRWKEDTLKSYVFKVVVEDDEHEDGRKAYQAYCPEIKEAVTLGDTAKKQCSGLTNFSMLSCR